MILIIPRISSSTTIADIQGFLKPGLRTIWPWKEHKVDGVRIKIYRDTKTGTLDYHALIFVQDDSLANKLIHRLNKKKLLHDHVIVREYFIRCWQNDRRLGLKSNAKVERRVSDRRRTTLKDISHGTYHVGHTSEEKFARK